jgi:hypothetical protein
VEEMIWLVCGGIWGWVPSLSMGDYGCRVVGRYWGSLALGTGCCRWGLDHSCAVSCVLSG